MKQVLILESNKELAILALHLSKNNLLNIIRKKEKDDFVSLLDLLGHADLVVCENIHQIELQPIYQQIPFFTFTASSQLESNLGQIFTMLNCSTENKISTMSVVEEYRPIPIDYFTTIKDLSVNSDLYIKLKKGETTQFVKRLNANEILTTEEIAKYNILGLKEFFVLSEKYDNVANCIINLLTDSLASDTMTYGERKSIEQNAYFVTADRLRTIGFDQFTLQIVEESITSIKKSVNDKSALGKFLKYLLENKSSYSYSISYLTCLTMTNLLKTFGWDNDTIKEQIAMVSFFHNISLEDEESLKIYSSKDLESLNLPKRKKDDIKMHALSSSGIMAKDSKISSIVLTIIKEHHGSTTGVDFPEALNPKLHPMSKCFMVCEYFADQILKKGPSITNSDVPEILEHLKDKFNSGAYLEYVNAIQKLTVA